MVATGVAAWRGEGDPAHFSKSELIFPPSIAAHVGAIPDTCDCAELRFLVSLIGHAERSGQFQVCPVACGCRFGFSELQSSSTPVRIPAQPVWKHIGFFLPMSSPPIVTYIGLKSGAASSIKPLA